MYRRMGVNAIIKPIGTNWLKISNESYIFAEPCHIGWIGVTKSYKTKFTSASKVRCIFDFPMRFEGIKN